MRRLLAAAAIAGTAVLGCASAANATVYNFNVYDAGFTGTLGTVTVLGQGTKTLSFDVSLNSNVFFQMTGNGNTRDIFWFDLTPFTGAVTTNITAPSGGSYPTGGQFEIVHDAGGMGQGWSLGYYGATASDSSAGGSLNYFTGHLAFTLTANDNSLLTLAGSTHNGSTVYGGADLRQCPGTDPTPSAGSCTTGPVGFTLSERDPNPNSAVPEPATWALMLLGFGFIGGMMRRRNSHQTLRISYT